MWKALIKLVEKWAYRCDHDFKLIDTRNKYETNSIEDKKVMLPFESRKTYMCKCGKIKSIKL